MASVTSWQQFDELCAGLLYIQCAAIKDPTSLALAFPYGGTVIGATTGHAFTEETLSGAETAHEFGGIPVGGVDNGIVAHMIMMLHTFDAVALAVILPGVTTSSLTGKPMVRPTTTNMRGNLWTTDAFKLLLAPRDTENQPALYMPLAVAFPDVSMKATRELGTSYGRAIAITALPDSSGRPYTEEFLEDMTL